MKTPKRFGAFLRLYGPRHAPSHAKLVIGHAPRRNTPEAFHDELQQERTTDHSARQAGIDAVMRLKFEGGW